MRRHMRRTISAGAGAAVLLSLLFAASALAAKRPPHAPSAPLEGHLRRGLGASDSTNWSGYAAYGTTFTAVRGNWVQPAANCESASKHGYTLAAFWVGLDGYEDNTVEQTGTEADCQGSTPVYYAWWELYPKGYVVIGREVGPKDEMHAEVTNRALVLEDVTKGWKETVPFMPGSLAFGSAEWIAEGPARNALTDFGSVHFSEASASRQTLPGGAIESGAIESKAWSDDAITLVGGSPAHATVLATPGALEEEAGASAFTIEANATSATHGHSGH